MTGRFPAFHLPFALARFECGLFAGVGRVLQQSASLVAEGIRLLRSAPPLGDVGTQGKELTAWADVWNRRGNPCDSNRE